MSPKSHQHGQLTGTQSSQAAMTVDNAIQTSGALSISAAGTNSADNGSINAAAADSQATIQV